MKLAQIKIYHLLLLGLILRIIFMLWGAPIYYGMPDYTMKWGDTHAWLSCLKNLVHNGIYSADLNDENGKFFRPPGYTFFMLPFYFLCGFNVKSMFLLVQIVQILLDTLSVWLIFRIVLKANGSDFTALISSFLYCIYPFAIVWSPSLVAESPGIFFTLLSLFFFLEAKTNKNYIWAGISAGFATLLRVQTVFFIPSIIIYWIIKNKSITSVFQKKIIAFGLAFCLSYGLWPLRNLYYDKFIPAEEIENNKHFSKDFVSYMFYIWSVKTDYNPQYNQIIQGQKVEWPKASYLNEGDSVTLAKLSEKCFSCGRGFSYWKASEGIIKTPIVKDNECTNEIARTFDRLRKEQIRDNPINYYLIVPLTNLKKALFKFSLNGTKSKLVRIVSSGLFLFRTLFIFLGIVGIWLNKKQSYMNHQFLTLIFTYFVLWYFVLCFGFRNIEIRYFLINDVLLLIPAGITIQNLFKKIGLINKHS